MLLSRHITMEWPRKVCICRVRQLTFVCPVSRSVYCARQQCRCMLEESVITRNRISFISIPVTFATGNCDFPGRFPDRGFYRELAHSVLIGIFRYTVPL